MQLLQLKSMSNALSTGYSNYMKTASSLLWIARYHPQKIFAESRVAALSRSQGWEAGPGQLGKIMGDIRRALSVTIARANAMCLLERLSQLGPGAGAAAKRRQVALQLEERRRQDRQAFDLAWQARGASRVGRAFVQ